MIPIFSPWPFAQWVVDILGPLPMASAQRCFLFVAIDYFSKWVEAEVVAKITHKAARKFILKHMVALWDPTRHYLR